MKLYTFRVEHFGQIIQAAHLTARDAAEARAKVRAEYVRTHTVEHLAKIRAASPELADICAAHPPVDACQITVKPSKARNAADWAVF